MSNKLEVYKKFPSTRANNDASHDAAISEDPEVNKLNHRFSKNLYDDVITGLYSSEAELSYTPSVDRPIRGRKLG